MKKFFIPTTLLLLPIVAFAQTGTKSFQEIVTDLVITGSNYILRLLVALTLFVFLYGLMKYLYKGQESDTARADGRKFMLWGIVGLFVMVSIWGLVGLLTSVIGQESTAIPQFKTEQENAPYGRFADGTPLSKQEYQSGQVARKAIENAVEELPSRTKQVLSKAGEAAGAVKDTVVEGAISIWNFFKANPPGPIQQ